MTQAHLSFKHLLCKSIVKDVLKGNEISPPGGKVPTTRNQISEWSPHDQDDK